jgi:arylsulfatase A-like enzyme
MADDMRADDLNWMPNVKNLIAAQGASFVNSFAPYPLCCPSRASFLKGQYAHNHGVLGNSLPFGFPAFGDKSTIATDLQRAGYATVFLGKYLNHYGPEPAPDGSSDHSTHYVPPGWTDWRGAPEVMRHGRNHGGPYNYRDTTLNVNGTLQPHQGAYQTKLFGKISTAIIDHRASGRPFFFWASYVAPHFGSPVEPDDLGVSPAVTDAVRDRFDNIITSPPGSVEGDVSDKPLFIQSRAAPSDHQIAVFTEHYRQRIEALTILDYQVKETIAALRRSGELANTFVIFTSDNGYLLGEHRTGGKILPYEPSLRVPLVIRGPGIPAGVTRDDPAMTIDLAPTIDQMASASTPRDMDGQSLLQTARTGDDGWTRAVLTETGPYGQLDSWMQGATTDPGSQAARFGLGIRTARYLYVRWASEEFELYDLSADPEEFNNVVDDPAYALVLESLRSSLAAIRDCHGAGCRQPLPSDLTDGLAGRPAPLLPL